MGLERGAGGGGESGHAVQRPPTDALQRELARKQRKGILETGVGTRRRRAPTDRRSEGNDRPPPADADRASQLQEHRRLRYPSGAAFVPRRAERVGKEQFPRCAPLRRRFARLFDRPRLARPGRDRRSPQAFGRPPDPFRNPARIQPRGMARTLLVHGRGETANGLRGTKRGVPRRAAGTAKNPTITGWKRAAFEGARFLPRLSRPRTGCISSPSPGWMLFARSTKPCR